MGQKHSVEELVSFLIVYGMSDLTFSSQFDFLASGHRLETRDPKIESNWEMSPGRWLRPLKSLL